MSVRFWRRIRLFPGVTLNIGKTGVSITVGIRGARWTIGRRGHTASVGLPGTGLSYRKQVSHEDVVEEVQGLADRGQDEAKQEPPPRRPGVISSSVAGSERERSAKGAGR